MVESVVSLCQFLYVIAMSSLPMSEKRITMGRMLVSVCDVCWDNKWLRLWVKAFFDFLMMRCSGYGRASRMRVRLSSSSRRLWSSERIMLYPSAWE